MSRTQNGTGSAAVVAMLTLLATISGCTTYKEMGIAGGVTAIQLNADTWLFNSRGNAFSNEQKINDFLMLRAAETAIDHGFTHFTPLEQRLESKQYVMSTGGEASSYASCGSTSCSVSAEASGPSTSTFYKPQGVLKARFINVQAGNAPSNAISARLIYDQLAPKYISKSKSSP